MWELIVGGALALTGAITSAVANKRAQRRQNAYNDQAAETAYNQQQELIDKQNEYNSPSNQMRLLEDAGLNPLLAYGSLGSATQQSAGTPQVAQHNYSPQAETLNIVGQGLSNVINMMGEIAKIRQMNQQTQYMEQQTQGSSLMNAYRTMYNANYNTYGMLQGAYKTQAMGSKAQILRYDENLAKINDQIRSTYGSEYENSFRANWEAQMLRRDQYAYVLDKLLPQKYELGELMKQQQKINLSYLEEMKENAVWRKTMERKFMSGNYKPEDALKYIFGNLIMNIAPSLPNLLQHIPMTKPSVFR